jgi:hypothetical protein
MRGDFLSRRPSDNRHFTLKFHGLAAFVAIL